MIDVGTGAGFPGIPIKNNVSTLHKQTNTSHIKKTITKRDSSFLHNYVIDELGLESIETVHGRARQYQEKKNFVNNMTCVYPRAVANLINV